MVAVDLVFPLPPSLRNQSALFRSVCVSSGPNITEPTPLEKWPPSPKNSPLRSPRATIATSDAGSPPQISRFPSTANHGFCHRSYGHSRESRSRSHHRNHRHHNHHLRFYADAGTLHAAPAILGSGGSRLLVHGTAHAALEARLARAFRSPAALLFNSGFDANAGFFACVPQTGDALVHDAAIHASVHDGARTSRIAPGRRRAFAHNDSVYSMDGTVAPLCAMLDTMDAVFPAGNAHMVVDEAHATGLYGPEGRGLVALLGVEK
ncbi:pyridoxal phosphate-dependent transferase, partial [Lactarius indigo]